MTDETTITMRSGDLRRMLRQTVPTAATDYSRPVLTAVRLESAPGRLRATTADGFQLVVARQTEHVEASGTGDAMLSADDAKRLLKAMPTSKKDAGVPVTLIFLPHGVKLTATVDGASLTFDQVQGTYPNYEQLIPDAKSGDGVGEGSNFAVNPQLLRKVADAAKLADDDSNIVRTIAPVSPSQPIVHTVGVDLLFVTMPMFVKWEADPRGILTDPEPDETPPDPDNPSDPEVSDEITDDDRAEIARINAERPSTTGEPAPEPAPVAERVTLCDTCMQTFVDDGWEGYTPAEIAEFGADGVPDHRCERVDYAETRCACACVPVSAAA